MSQPLKESIVSFCWKVLTGKGLYIRFVQLKKSELAFSAKSWGIFDWFGLKGCGFLVLC